MGERPLLVFVPALVVALRAAERRRGQPLTEHEVIAVRDNASVIALPPDEALKFLESPGYPDIIRTGAGRSGVHLRDQT